MISKAPDTENCPCNEEKRLPSTQSLHDSHTRIRVKPTRTGGGHFSTHSQDREIRIPATKASKWCMSGTESASSSQPFCILILKGLGLKTMVVSRRQVPASGVISPSSTLCIGIVFSRSAAFNHKDAQAYHVR